jgi:hypothetical protein
MVSWLARWHGSIRQLMAQTHVDSWNRALPVGTAVYYLDENGARVETTTRAQAWVTEDHRSVINVHGVDRALPLLEVETVSLDGLTCEAGLAGDDHLHICECDPDHAGVHVCPRCASHWRDGVVVWEAGAMLRTVWRLAYEHFTRHDDDETGDGFVMVDLIDLRRLAADAAHAAVNDLESAVRERGSDD